MKRRGFLGLFGAAAVSGPSIAKSAIAELPSGLGAGGARLAQVSHTLYGQSSDEWVPKPQEGYDWRLEEIKKLQAWLSGEKSDDEKQREEVARIENRRVFFEQNIASLRSVSGVSKMRMFVAADLASYEAQRRKVKEISLSQLLRDVAGLK